MRYPCVESTVNVFVGGLTVRLWIDQNGYIPDDHAKEQELIKRLMRLEGYSINGILAWCLEMVSNLNAVEVRNGAIGTVVYKVDFENHG